MLRAVATYDKFPFAADADAVDVADIPINKSRCAGQSSTTDGYASGGGYNPGSTSIQKFPFAADVNSVEVGDLSVARGFQSGQNSSTRWL